ncbi:MAG TPA: hypothetical protein VF735_19045 [Pyrinomonadaceae bacterium]|jgi:hypothetical protein
MIKSTLLFITLALLSHGPARPQDQKDVLGDIERAITSNGSDWDCTRLYESVGVPAKDAPRGVSYHFQCKRRKQIIHGEIFYGESKREAVRMLEWSQSILQINESKALEGVGDGAYRYAKNGAAWITFCKANVFGQLNVSLVDPRKVDADAPETEGYTTEAAEVAHWFAQQIAEQIPAS